MDIFVDVQQKIHRIDAESLESMFERLARKIELATILDKKKKALLIHKLESMSLEKKLCHGDYHFNNLIVSDSEVSIIDWVDSCSGDIRADVYRTYLTCLQISKDLADLYLCHYCDKSGLTKEEIYQWAPIISAARLSENDTSERIEQLLKIINDNLTR